MIYKKIQLSEICKDFNNPATFLEVYSFADQNEGVMPRKRPGLLIVPGGGYEFVSLREGAPVACRFLSEGFICFVLTYSINSKYPLPHNEMATVMNYINEHADEFNVYKNSISVIGFSAGGHLCASYSYLYKELAVNLGFKEESCRPFTTNLSYPVITFTKPTHDGTKNTITGGDPELIEKLSCENHITSDYPPTFIWTTSPDTCVPYISSLLMVEALKKANVPYQYEEYSVGWHGLSILTRAVDACEDTDQFRKVIYNWVEKDVNFIYSHLDKKFPL